MYTSNLSTTLSPESRERRQKENNFSIWRRSNGEDRIEYTKRCPSCGGELIWLPEKFGEIQQPSGPGPPAYSQSKEPYQNSGEGNYQEIPARTPPIGYSESRSSREAVASNYRQKDYRSPSRERFANSGYGQRRDEYAVANREYQDQSYQQRSDSQHYRTGHYQRGETQTPYRDTSDNYRDTSDNHRDTSDNYRDTSDNYRDTSRSGKYGASNYSSQNYNYDLKDPLNGGWYCSSCGLHLMSNEQLQSYNMESAEPKEEPEQVPAAETDEKQDSPGGKANKSIDEEYVMWENQINKDFSEFLTHIKNYFSEKENKLKEYQVDLCQREKSLQANEGYFKERIDTLTKAEEEFQDKVERLNLQVQDRMQRLREYEAKITRLSNVKKNTRDASVQTQASFHYDHAQNRNSPHSGQQRSMRENYGLSIGYHLINKGASPQPQQPPATFEERRKRLLEGSSVQNNTAGPPSVDEKQVNGQQLKSVSGMSDGDYMFMGSVNKPSPAEIAGSPYYIDLQNVPHQAGDGHLHNGDMSSSYRPEHSPNPVNGVFVDTSNGHAAVDSGFNTPDAPVDKATNHYQYPQHDYQQAQQPAKTSHVMRPRDRKQLRGNISNNSNNNTTDAQSANSGSARNSVSEYGGERAILVKSPNDVESYTTRAQKYLNSGVHRSSSLPQNKTAETPSDPVNRSRSPSPNRIRTRSVPPEQGHMFEEADGISKELQPRPNSEHSILERPRSSSFGSNTDTCHQSKAIAHAASSSVVPNSMRTTVDDRTIKPNQGGVATNQRKFPTDFEVDVDSRVGLRSRSSESVRRSHPVNKYHHARGASYGEIKKKAQSEMNLSSEKWNDDDDEGIVINHRKSTSFDSPRSKPGYVEHFYQTKTDPKMTQTIEVQGMNGKPSESQQLASSKQGTNNMGKMANGHPSAYDRDSKHNGPAKSQPNVTESLKPQNQIYENIKSVTKHGTDHHTNSSHINQKPRVRGRRSDMSIPHRRLNKVAYYTASGTNLNQNSFDSSDASAAETFQQRSKYQKDPVTARTSRSGHQPVTSHYNSNSVAVVNYHPASTSKPDYHRNQVGDSKNHQEKNMAHPTHERLPSIGYNIVNQNRIDNHVRPVNETVDRDEGVCVDISNDRSNESPEMTSTPRDHMSDHTGDYATNTNPVNKEGATSHQAPKPQQRLYYNGKSSAVNGKIDLSDKDNWAIRRRRDQQQKPKPIGGDMKQPSYTKDTMMNGDLNTPYYENVPHRQAVKENTRRSRLLRAADLPRKEEQHQLNHRIGNSEKYPDSGYHQRVPEGSRATLAYKDEKKPQPVENHKMTNNTSPDATGTDSPGKKRLFGFSPRYKEILFKYGNGGKPKSGKQSPKKVEDKNNNNSVDSTSKGSSRTSSKKGQVKDKEVTRSKDGRDVLSPKSKLPQYNNYLKEVSSK